MGNLLFSLFYKRCTRTNILSFFYVILYLLLIIVTSFHELPDAVCEECFQLCAKVHMHHILDLFIVCRSVSTCYIFEWSKNVVIRQGEI